MSASAEPVAQLDRGRILVRAPQGRCSGRGKLAGTLCGRGFMRPSMFANDNPRPVNKILGKRTLWVLAEPDRAESFILEHPRSSRRCGIEGYTILARGPELTAEQVASLQQMVFEPLSYYDGRPIFKRLPSVPDFAFRLHREETRLDLLVDLHNPGWEFYCETERHWGWNWVGEQQTTQGEDSHEHLGHDTRYQLVVGECPARAAANGAADEGCRPNAEGHPPGAHGMGAFCRRSARTAKPWPREAEQLESVSSSCGTWPLARRRPPSRGTRSRCRSVAFSPDGKTLASGGGGGLQKRPELKLWDVATGKEKAGPPGAHGR